MPANEMILIKMDKGINLGGLLWMITDSGKGLGTEDWSLKKQGREEPGEEIYYK